MARDQIKKIIRGDTRCIMLPFTQTRKGIPL